jgi:hypothetical protein
MLISGGGTATLPYTIQTAAGSGSTLLFTGGSVAVGNIMQVTVPSAGSNLTNRAFSSSFNVFVLMQPSIPQAAGGYSDALTAWLFNLVVSGSTITGGTSIFSRAFNVTGTVSKVCTIGGVATPAADTATIPVSATGVVNTTAIAKSYTNVACNTPSDLQLTSQSGGVKSTATAPSGFTNIINYSASATFSSATATVNTATTPTAAGPEPGTAVSTTGATPSGTMSLTITPQTSAQPLVAGTYADTLTITITPQ